MRLTRRNFLVAGSAIGLAALTSLKRGLARTLAFSQGQHQFGMVRHLVKESFEPLVGTAFKAESLNGATAKLKLIEVTELVIDERLQSADVPRQSAFSILFRGPKKRVLPQGMYLLTSPLLGSFSLLMVPSGRDKKGRPLYESVFNRIV